MPISASPPANVVRASECAESPYANGPYTLRGSELGSGVARQPRGGGCIDRSGGLSFGGRGSDSGGSALRALTPFWENWNNLTNRSDAELTTTAGGGPLGSKKN